MTEPTDDELDTVLCSHWPAFSMQATLVRIWMRAAMRDALAKWSTPAVAKWTPPPQRPPWIKPGHFFGGGRPAHAMDIDPGDFYGITEAIHHALEMLETHPEAGTDSSPLDPKRSRRLRQALMAAWLLEYPEEANAMSETEQKGPPP